MIPSSMRHYPESICRPTSDDEEALSIKEAEFIADDLKLIMTIWTVSEIVDNFKRRGPRYYYYEFPNMFSTCSGWLPSKSMVIEIKDTNKS